MDLTENTELMELLREILTNPSISEALAAYLWSEAFNNVAGVILGTVFLTVLSYGAYRIIKALFKDMNIW